MRLPKGERGSAYVVINFVLAVGVAGFLYTLINGVLGRVPAGPGTGTMQFLDYVLDFALLPMTFLVIFWLLNNAQKRRYYTVEE